MPNPTEPLSQASGNFQFDSAIARMRPLLNALQSSARRTSTNKFKIAEAAGAYLFSDGDTPMYVGQSRNLSRRYGEHTRPSSDHNQASFAFLLARHEAGEPPATAQNLSRSALQIHDWFSLHFKTAKERVAGMTYQHILISNPIERTIFEVFAALALETGRFNSLETH